MYTINYTCTLYNIHCTLYTLHCTLQILSCTRHTVLSEVFPACLGDCTFILTPHHLPVLGNWLSNRKIHWIWRTITQILQLWKTTDTACYVGPILFPAEGFCLFLNILAILGILLYQGYLLQQTLKKKLQITKKFKY